MAPAVGSRRLSLLGSWGRKLDPGTQRLGGLETTHSSAGPSPPLLLFPSWINLHVDKPISSSFSSLK